MSLTKLRTEVRQDQIAQVALNLLAKEGFKGISLAKVARKVNMVPSAIYRHFKDKEAVLDVVLDLIEKRMLRNVKAARESSSDPFIRLHGLLKRHIAVITEGNAIVPRIVFSEDASGDRSRRKARIFGIISAYLAGVAEIVAEGQREGRIRQDLDPAIVSTMFLGLIQPPAILWHLSEGKVDIESRADGAWKILSAAIAGPCGVPSQAVGEAP